MKQKFMCETGRGSALHSEDIDQTWLNLATYFCLPLSPRKFVKSLIKNGALRYPVCLALAVVLSSTVHARRATDYQPSPQPTSMSNPAYCLARHDIGNVVFGVSNNGTIGRAYSSSGGQDCFTGEQVPALEFPKGSNTRYLYGAALWIGAVVGKDTLVSIGQDGWAVSDAEFHPDEPPLGNMIYRSTIDPLKPEFNGAISQQDYIAVCTDTFTAGVSGIYVDEVDHRLHLPLHIEVTQRSFAWSYSYAEDFVLIDYSIQNIGEQNLSDVYFGIFVDADIHSESWDGHIGAQDDISGFLRSVPATYLPDACHDSDVINMAWAADNDGDLETITWFRVLDVSGIRVLRAPLSAQIFSYNWWTSNGDTALDFGPQTRAMFRLLEHGGMGTPIGDRNKYHYLSNGEVDFDQVFTGAVSENDSLWLTPSPTVAEMISLGSDTKYLLSVGPIDIQPGQMKPITIAFVAGENLHADTNNYNNHLADRYDPDEYYRNLDFSDVSKNAIWADWVFDVPGVDTDSDGYAGEIDTCFIGDTSFQTVPRTGDGVPDFRAECAPAAPKMWITSEPGSLKIRWNGQSVESSVDIFSKLHDFEGYRVYIGRQPRRSSFIQLASCDIVDYRRFVWNSSTNEFELTGIPLRVDTLRCLYAPASCYDSSWHPSHWTHNQPFVYSTGASDSVFYFEPFGENTSNFGLETPILKRFPDASRPPTDWIEDVTLIPDSLRDLILTEDGYFKYYEYEYRIINILPDIPYWVSVTAYDFGSWFGISPQESSVVESAQVGTALQGAPVCCIGLTGNIDDDPDDWIDISDLSALIDYLFVRLIHPHCMEEANCDGSTNGVVDIGDLTALIDYLFITFTPPAECL